MVKKKKYNLMQVKNSYLTKDEFIRIYGKKELLRLIENSHSNYVEYATQSIRKVYFDVDADESFELVNKETSVQILNLITTVLFQFFKTYPDSICQNVKLKKSELDQEENINLERLSWHLTIPYKITVDDNKKIAEELNKVLRVQYAKNLPEINSFPLFDLNVYKTKQAWRLVNQVRPSCDTKKTPSKKVLISGLIENTIIQDCTDLGLFEYKTKKDIQGLQWFYERFEDKSNLCYWTTKADNYSDWIEFAIICIYLSGFLDRNDVFEKNNVQEVFLKFSQFSQKFNFLECQKTFDSMWTNNYKSILVDERSKKLEQKWKKDFEKKNGKKTYESCEEYTYGTEYETSTNNILEDFVLLLGIPITSTGFFIKSIINLIEFRCFFQGLLQSYDHLKFMCQVLKYIPDDEKDQLVSIQECVKEAVKQTGFNDDPYEGEVLDNIDIIFFLANHSKIDCNEDQKKTLKEILTDGKINIKAFEAFIKKIEEYVEKNELQEVFENCLKKYEDEKQLAIYQRAEKELDSNVTVFLTRILTKKRNWKYQYPYYVRLQTMMNDCNQDETLFWLIIVRAASKLFVCEPFLHCLCRAHSDDMATKIVLDVYRHWMSTPQGVLMFDSVTGMWTDKKTVWCHLISMLSNFLQDEKKNYGSSVELTKKILERIVVFVDQRTDRFDALKDSSLGKLLFGNGYYDAKKSTFYCSHQFDIFPTFTNVDVLFMGRINDPFYVDDVDKIIPEMEEMNEVMFNQMHGVELAEYHKECLSLALFGERYKGFYVHVGEPNSGKSTEKAMIEACFGSFVGAGLVDELSVIKDDRRDPAIANSMVYDNWYKRLLLFSEKSNRKIDTEKLKSYSSGGQDKIRARTQFKTAVSLDIHFIMFFYLNHPMEVNSPEDAAYKDRSCVFHWDKSFEDPENITDPTCQIPKRDDVCQWQYSLRKRQVYTMLFVKSFENYMKRGHRLQKPEKVKLSTNTIIGSKITNKDMVESFLGYFIVDGDQNDHVLYSDIQKICKDVNIDPYKFIRRLPLLMQSLKPDLCCPIQSAQKRLQHNQRVQVWKGLRIRTDESDPEPLLSNFDLWKKLMVEGNGKIDKKIQFNSLGDKRTIENIS
jgi:hypothetical protein